MLTENKSEDEFGDEVNVEAAGIGAKGVGFIYRGNESEGRSLLQRLKGQLHGSDDEHPSTADHSDAEESDDGFEDNALVDDSKLFYNEVGESIKRGLDENIAVENLVLEINSSKYAYNVSMKEVNTIVTQVILESPSPQNQTPLDNASFLNKLKTNLGKMVKLFQNYMKSVDSQVDCLTSVEDYFHHHPAQIPCIKAIVATLYSEEIVTEDAIEQWHAALKSSKENPETQKLICKQIAPFMEWLKNAEEETDSDSDESD